MSKRETLCFKKGGREKSRGHLKKKAGAMSIKFREKKQGTNSILKIREESETYIRENSYFTKIAQRARRKETPSNHSRKHVGVRIRETAGS